MFLNEHAPSPVLGKVEESDIISSYTGKVILHFQRLGLFRPQRQCGIGLNSHQNISHEYLISMTLLHPKL